MLAFNLAVLAAWWPLRLIDARSYLLWFAVQVMISVLWLPWLLSIFALTQNFTWPEQVTPRLAVRQLFAVFGANRLGPLQSAFNLVVIGAAVLGMAFAVNKRQFGVVVLIGLLVFFVPVLIWLTGIATPIFLPRTVLACLIGGALGLGLAVSLSPSRLLALAILAFVLAGSLVSTANYLDSGKKEAWNEAAATVTRNFADGDAIFLCPFFGAQPLHYYLGTATSDRPMFGWDGDHGVVVGIERVFVCSDCRAGTFPNRHEVRRFEDMKAAHRRLWVVRSTGGHYRAPHWNLLRSKLQDLGYRLTGEEALFRVAMDRYDRD